MMCVGIVLGQRNSLGLSECYLLPAPRASSLQHQSRASSSLEQLWFVIASVEHGTDSAGSSWLMWVHEKKKKKLYLVRKYLIRIIISVPWELQAKFLLLVPYLCAGAGDGWEQFLFCMKPRLCKFCSKSWTCLREKFRPVAVVCSSFIQGWNFQLHWSAG